MNECIIEASTSGEESMLAIFKESWPPLFYGKKLDKLTGKALQWRTIQNRRSRREIPENCFTKVGIRKVLDGSQTQHTTFFAYIYKQNSYPKFPDNCNRLKYI